MKDTGKNPHQNLPIARSEQLVVHELPDELLVYDLRIDKAHCLNPTAAFVWRSCDGRTTVDEIAAAYENRTGHTLPPGAVRLALRQLTETDLLQEGFKTEFDGMTRRRALMKMGLSAAVLPVIASLVAPVAAQVQCSGIVTSCIQCADGTPCNVDGDGVIGTCAGGACIGD